MMFTAVKTLQISMLSCILVVLLHQHIAWFCIFFCSNAPGVIQILRLLTKNNSDRTAKFRCTNKAVPTKAKQRGERKRGGQCYNWRIQLSRLGLGVPQDASTVMGNLGNETFPVEPFTPTLVIHGCNHATRVQTMCQNVQRSA